MQLIQNRCLLEIFGKQAIANVKDNNSELHFIGLLSDGNVHAHEDHLYA